MSFPQLKRLAGRPLEVWFQDEARVGQQGTVTRIWAQRGTRPRMQRDRRFTWAYIFGAICPARGAGCAIVMPTVNIEAMNKHLAETSKCVADGAVALMLLDGAGWHRSPQVEVPENIVLLPLPAYAPELNSAETSGNISEGTYSATPSGRHMRPSSTPAATPGTPSSLYPTS